MSPEARSPVAPEAELLARTGRRLTLLTLGLLAALVVGIGVTTVIAARAALDSSVDRALETSASATLSGLDGELPTAGDGESGDTAEHAPAAADTFFLVLDPGGTVVADPSRVTVSGLPDLAAVSAARSGGRDLRTVFAGGLHVRLLTLPIVSRRTGEGSGPVGFVQAGFILTLSDQQSAALILAIVVVGLAGLVAAAMVSRLVTTRALAPIKAAFDTERRFVADASHELRTPVALIRASAEVLQREGLVTESGRTLATDIVGEADRMTRLVGDLLTLSAAQAAPLPLVREPLDLRQVVQDTVRRVRPLADERGVRLELTGASIRERATATSAQPVAAFGAPARSGLAMAVRPGSPPEAASSGSPALPPDAGSVRLLGDRDRLSQILVILLDNALRHSPKGSVVRVSLEADAGKALLSVADQGPGVPTADRERIFEPFARLGAARSSGDGGSGLGLAIARTVAAAHGGSISVADSPGGGARFTVSLPLV